MPDELGGEDAIARSTGEITAGPTNVTETRLGVGRAASGRPLGVSTVRESRRGHEDDVILARGNQYSTGRASASHSFSTKLQLGKKEKKMAIDFR